MTLLGWSLIALFFLNLVLNGYRLGTEKWDIGPSTPFSLAVAALVDGLFIVWIVQAAV